MMKIGRRRIYNKSYNDGVEKKVEKKDKSTVSNCGKNFQKYRHDSTLGLGCSRFKILIPNSQ